MTSQADILLRETSFFGVFLSWRRLCCGLPIMPAYMDTRRVKIELVLQKWDEDLERCISKSSHPSLYHCPSIYLSSLYQKHQATFHPIFSYLTLSTYLCLYPSDAHIITSKPLFLRLSQPNPPQKLGHSKLSNYDPRWPAYSSIVHFICSHSLYTRTNTRHTSCYSCSPTPISHSFPTHPISPLLQLYHLPSFPIIPAPSPMDTLMTVKTISFPGLSLLKLI